MLIWTRQRCLFHREVDGLADRPVVDQPAPLPAWQVQAMLRACGDQARLPGELRMALAEAGLPLPPGPDHVAALIGQVAERVASGALRMVIRPPAQIVVSFDSGAPLAHRMDATLRLPVADGAARRAAALRLLRAALAPAQRDQAIAAAFAHPAGAAWRREVPRPAAGGDLEYAAELLASRLLLLTPQGPRGDSFRLAWTLADSQPDAPPLPLPPPPPPPPPKPKPKEEVGELSVHVTRPDGTPIEGVDVNVEGLGLEKTDKDGWARYGKVACRGYDATAKKKGFSNTEGGEFKAAEGSGTVVEEEHTIIELVLYPYRIISIAGSVRGTPGLRNPANKRRRDPLKKSTTDDKALATNEPSVVVRGCHRIRLIAETSPPNQPVEWSVEANENDEAAPGIKAEKNAWEAILQTNKPGSFSVIGTCGENKIVWNVVFVWVKPDVAAGIVRKSAAYYADNGSTVERKSFRSGDFDGKGVGKYAWQVTIPVKLIGGGGDKKLGIDKVSIQYLQNGSHDTLTGHYGPEATVTEVPLGGLPVLDSEGPDSPTGDSPGCVEVTPNQTAARREIWMADSPCGGFDSWHPTTRAHIIRTSGINGFLAAVCSVSSDAPNSYVVHAKGGWAAHYIGEVKAGRLKDGTRGWYWFKEGATTTGDNGFALISPGTGGQDAAAARIETFEPRFNNGTDQLVIP